MILRNLAYLLFPTLFTACQKQLAVPLPEVRWDLFQAAGADPLPVNVQHRMEGVYAVTEGSEVFGDQVVVKWSFLTGNSDTTYHVSIFGEKNICYMTGLVRQHEGAILMNMYWRTLVNSNTGPSWLTIMPQQGAELLADSDVEITPGSIHIEGHYGDSRSDPPTDKFAMHYVRPLNQDTSFSILAHRGGGRNADQLPASENSIELIRMAPRLGATGIEIDVKLTSDDVPILYHDDNLNPRLVRDVGLLGPIKEYSHAQLDGIVRLVNGERIPTLREALLSVLHETNLQYVWLDLKYEGSLAPVYAVQKEMMELAQAEGRDVRILFGLPGTEQVDQFKELENFQSIASLCELSLDVVRELDSEIWAPMWVMGQQDAEVQEMHGEGRKAFVWTMDVPGFIQQYMYEGHYDGILSNYPSLVAYYHYVRQ